MPEHRPDSAMEVTSPMGGKDRQKGAPTFSGATLDKRLDDLYTAIKEYVCAHKKWREHKPPSANGWKRFGVDPLKFTFQPEFGNTISGTFDQPTLALNNTTFKPVFKAAYELSFKEALKDRAWGRYDLLQYLTLSVTGGTEAPSFKLVDGVSQLVQSLRPTFAIYAKIEVPLSNIWGSTRLNDDEKKKKENTLNEAELKLLRQLDQAVREIRELLREKQGEIGSAR
jgi:hypothetical protein